MALTGQQIKQLQQALLDAFPSKALLEMMVRIELNEQLDAIAQGDNQTVIVYQLITWAERTGNVRALIAGGAAQNRRNLLVARLATDSRSWRSTSPSYQPRRASDAPPPAALPPARRRRPPLPDRLRLGHHPRRRVPDGQRQDEGQAGLRRRNAAAHAATCRSTASPACR